MKIDLSSGVISTARYCESPNCDERPDRENIELLVIHNISLPPGDFGGDCIDRLFTNTLDITQHESFLTLGKLKVSSHCLIRRTGELVQYVPLHKRAWHAGVSEYNGKSRCNDFSIGIELEGTDTVPYTDTQYEALIQVSRLLFEQYPKLSASTCVGHCDIAPKRKTDPGPSFDWERFRRGL